MCVCIEYIHIVHLSIYIPKYHLKWIAETRRTYIQPCNIEYGKEKAKFINTQIMTKYGETPKIVVAYILPKNKIMWAKE